MIELEHVSKRFNNEYVLKDINIKFPQYGIVAIYGPSGCGKTTLLNVISSLYDFEGEISFWGKKYSLMNEKDKDEIRNSKIGFIFQDFKLFDFESVKNNIMLTMDLKSDDKKAIKERRIRNLLDIVDLSTKEKDSANKLSGGEKQRVAIARALCNSPKVILADEPTGNLDEKNSEKVMEILKRVAKTSLIILVSHDEKLTKKYADEIVYMNDGRITNIKYQAHNEHTDKLPLISITPKESKARLPINFALSHGVSNIRRRKWRTLFALGSTSLGLIGVGLGSTISGIVSSNLYESYSSIIGPSKVVITSKNKGNLHDNYIISTPFEEVNDIYLNSTDNVSSIGIYYWNDFEKMFTSYSMSIDLPGNNKSLPEYTLRNINEYYPLSKIKTVIYPYQLADLSNDEVVLGLTYPLLNEICFQLQIPRTVDSLSTFFKNHDMDFSTLLENLDWSYEKEFTLKVMGFSMMNQNVFVHSSGSWNEYIFEKVCGLSTTEYINVNSKNPWDLKKSYYLDFKNGRDEFLEEVKFAKKYRYQVAEILDEKYYPLLYKGYATEECSRVCLLNMEHSDLIEPFQGSYFKSVSKHISSLIYGSDYCYAIYPDNLMMGFARMSYLSNDYSKIEEAIDLTAYLKYEVAMNINLPNSVVVGHFTKPNSGGLTFNPGFSLISGKKPTSYQEIVISEGIRSSLGVTNPINQIVYFSFPTTEELLPNGYLKRDYRTVGLKVVGVSSSMNLEVNHKEEWSVLFFQSMLGISSFQVMVNSIALNVDEDTENEVISSFKVAFPKLNAVSPISSVKDSVKKVCSYIEIALIIFSISSVVIASLILSICNYLHFIEIRKDIGLVRCLGLNKKESEKFVSVHSFLMSGLSLLISSIELVVVSAVISKAMSEIYHTSFSLSLNPFAFLYMFLLSTVMALLTSFVIKRKINRLNPLEALCY